MEKHIEKYMELVRKGDDICIRNRNKINDILGTNKHIYTPINGSTVMINDKLKVSGFYLFITMKARKGYMIMINTNIVKNFSKHKKILDKLVNMATNGEKTTWGGKPDENGHIALYYEKFNSENIHKLAYHYILPLISMMKYLDYIDFVVDKKHNTRFYFIITKIKNN